MLRIMGWCVIGCLVVLAVVNGAFMLASPRAWYRLPRWMGLQGSLTEEKYSTGWGALQVRLTGAVFLAVIAWAVYDSLLRPRPHELWGLTLRIMGSCVVAIVAVVMVVNTAVMLASPRMWFRLPRWIRAQSPFTEERYASGWGAVELRLIGAACLAVAAWIIYYLLLSYG